MTQEWTRFVPCYFALLLRPRQEGAAQVDTPTTPCLVQVHRHRTLFVVSRVRTVKLTAILYTTPTLKSIDIANTKPLSHKHKNNNANDNKNKRSERDNIKMPKTPRRNAKNNNYMQPKNLKRNVPFM